MADEFDRYLAAALAPAERVPDRQFVSRVQAGILLEQRLAAERRSLIGGLIEQLVALAAVAAALWWVARAQPVAAWLARSPNLALAILVASFALLIATFLAATGFRSPAFTKLNGS